jgi:hypothetical protein
LLFERRLTIHRHRLPSSGGRRSWRRTWPSPD